jgi:two-component system, NarL family, nitrate/nitrite response regulator NarL
VRVLLVDDHHVVREAIAIFLRRAAADIDVVGANSVDQALERIAGHDPFDIILLDYKMPGMNGLAGLSTVSSAATGVPVAILSGEISAEDSRVAMDRGARGIILKTIHGTALVSALRQIVAGEISVPASLRQPAGTPVDDGGNAQMRQQLGNLTPREMDCVRLLARGATNRQIATELSLAEVTVKLHLHAAYKKMGARHRSDAVRIAMLNGMTAL